MADIVQITYTTSQDSRSFDMSTVALPNSYHDAALLTNALVKSSTVRGVMVRINWKWYESNDSLDWKAMYTALLAKHKPTD